MMKLCGMHAKAEQAGFIAVYPFGTGRFGDRLLSFNGGECGGHTWPGQPPVVARLGDSTMDISANDLMWKFFSDIPGPGRVRLNRKQLHEVRSDSGSHLPGDFRHVHSDNCADFRPASAAGCKTCVGHA
jgi:hypothetical protein